METLIAWLPRDRRYADLVISVAERYRPGADGGAPPPSDPDYRTEDLGAGDDRRRQAGDLVTYGEGGRWGNWADGGGSSLELTDPNADPRTSGERIRGAVREDRAPSRDERGALEWKSRAGVQLRVARS